jgi:hypothetical protein
MLPSNGPAKRRRYKQSQGRIPCGREPRVTNPLNAILGWAKLFGAARIRPAPKARRARNDRTQRCRNGPCSSRTCSTCRVSLAARCGWKLGASISPRWLRPRQTPSALRLQQIGRAFNPARFEHPNHGGRYPPAADRLESPEQRREVHTERRRIRILLRRLEWSVEIEVTDTGAGISAAFLPRVFDAFLQEDASTRGHAVDSGLGSPSRNNSWSSTEDISEWRAKARGAAPRSLRRFLFSPQVRKLKHWRGVPHAGLVPTTHSLGRHTLAAFACSSWTTRKMHAA